MVKCPNRKRKTPHPLGGSPGCDGMVSIYFSVPVSFKMKKISSGGSQTILDALGKSLYGKKLGKFDMRLVHDAFNSGKWTASCGKCSFALRPDK